MHIIIGEPRQRAVGRVPEAGRGAAECNQGQWGDVRPMARDENVFCFAALGTVGFDGDSEDERDTFRLTCVAVGDGSRWRLRHFHGSAPQA